MARNPLLGNLTDDDLDDAVGAYSRRTGVAPIQAPASEAFAGGSTGNGAGVIGSLFNGVQAGVGPGGKQAVKVDAPDAQQFRNVQQAAESAANAEAARPERSPEITVKPNGETVIQPNAVPDEHRPQGTLQQQGRALSNMDVAGHNRLAELEVQQGDIKAEGASKRARTHADAAADIFNTNKNARDVQQGRFAQADTAIDEYEDMLRNAKSPIVDKRSIGQKIGSGIVTALSGLTGRGGVGLGPALGFINDEINKDLELEMQNKAKDASLLGAQSGFIQQLQQRGLNEQQAATAYIAAQRMGYAHQLEQWGAEQEEGESKTLAQKAAEDQRFKARNELQEQVKTDVALKKAADTKVQSELFWRMSEPQLIALKNANKLPKLGHEVLDKKLDMTQQAQQRALGLQNTQADIDKKRREGSGQTGVPQGAGIAGLRPIKDPNLITAKDYEQAKEISDAQSTLDNVIDKMVETQGNVSVQAKRNYDTNFALAVGALNKLANAGVLNPTELTAWKGRLPKHVIDNAADLNPVTKVGSWMVDEEQQLGDLRDQFKQLSSKNLQSRGYDYVPTKQADAQQSFSQGGGANLGAPADVPKPVIPRTWLR